jgi:hypothetical protein
MPLSHVNPQPLPRMNNLLPNPTSILATTVVGLLPTVFFVLPADGVRLFFRTTVELFTLLFF